MCVRGMASVSVSHSQHPTQQHLYQLRHCTCSEAGNVVPDLDCFSFSDYLFKLLLIGDSGVGKSCLLLRFAVSSSVSPSKTCCSITVSSKSAAGLTLSCSPHFICFLLCRMTPTQRATSAPSEWTLRSAPLNWMARPSNCRL